MTDKDIVISSMNKTWILDLDGTLVKHNGYLTDGYDTLLAGAKEFMDGIPSEDMIIIITARSLSCSDMTVKFLEKESIRYDKIIFDAPTGERILINDRKPSGLAMAVAVNTERDKFIKNKFIVNNNL